ncbi:unnamed protein product [Zymoseptoria tritici ST99CH_1E4]|uniref:Uncharacterized protein n=1 Tax=Zymoseptoria tritici ST99CH_1E4 TaxID=1276532 RepID=A0A2H1H9Q9_ZYMTR|nr:unnamed protein product [Zymoseptoria tritici ST99CH_1E4]
MPPSTTWLESTLHRALALVLVFYCHDAMGQLWSRFLIELALAVVLLMLQTHLPRYHFLVRFLNPFMSCFPLVIPDAGLALIHKFFILANFELGRLTRTYPPRVWTWPVLCVASLALHLIIAPVAEEMLLPALSIRSLKCANFLDVDKNNGEFRFNDRDEHLAMALDVGYRALQRIPKMGLEADFYSAVDALDIIAPSLKHTVTLPQVVKQVLVLVPSPKPDTSSSTFPFSFLSSSLSASNITPATTVEPRNYRLMKEYVDPHQDHILALANSIYTEINITRPIYMQWLSRQVNIHATLSSQDYPSLHNAFSNSCGFPWSWRDTVFWSIVKLRCVLLSPTTIRWIQEYYNGALWYEAKRTVGFQPSPIPFWHLHTHVLPTFAGELLEWNDTLVTNLPKIAPPNIPLKPLPIDEQGLRDLGITLHQATKYNHGMRNYFSAHLEPDEQRKLQGVEVDIATDLACVISVMENARIPSSRWSKDIWEVLIKEREKAQSAVLNMWLTTVGSDPHKEPKVKKGSGMEAVLEWIKKVGDLLLLLVTELLLVVTEQEYVKACLEWTWPCWLGVKAFLERTWRRWLELTALGWSMIFGDGAA